MRSLLLFPAALLCACVTTTGSPPDSGTAPSTDGGLCAIATRPEDTAAPAPLHTPRWAFEPWISKDISTGADTYAFVQGFKDRDIPVGVVVLDSPWETNYNTFIPNPSRYPQFDVMVQDLREQGVRTVLWVTQMVNQDSFDFEPGGDVYDGPAPAFDEGLVCGFYVNDGQTYVWWKGSGAGVDFLNPRASAWWHRQQDMLLDFGIAGWKLDFGDEYIMTPTVKTFAGEVPHQEYSEAYYRDYYAYGAARLTTEEFVTMVRPYDKSYQFSGRFYARKEHAPVTWVGDNTRDFAGLQDALDHIFRSAAAGYAVIGSDIGGYLDRDDTDITGQVIPFSQEVFARWTAVGAMTPFMQLHGRANITPWTVPERSDETVTLYRAWSKLHSALVPFFYSLAEEHYAGRAQLLTPVGEEAAWAGDYRFLVGNAFLVAPILAEGGARMVTLPAGARWFDWWDSSSDALMGGTTLDVQMPDRARIPLYVRDGAIIPLHVVDDTNGLGTVASRDALTVLAWPAETASTFALLDMDGVTTEIGARRDGAAAVVSLARVPRVTLVRMRVDAEPTTVTVGGTAAAQRDTRAAFDAADSGYFVESARQVWVKVPVSMGAVEIRAE